MQISQPLVSFDLLVVVVLLVAYLAAVARMARTPEGTWDAAFLSCWVVGGLVGWWMVGRIGDLGAFFVLGFLAFGVAGLLLLAIPVVAWHSWHGTLGKLSEPARAALVAVLFLAGGGARMGALRARTEHLQAHLVEVTERIEAGAVAVGEDPFAAAREFLAANPGIRARITTRSDGGVRVTFPIIRGDALVWDDQGWYWNDDTRKGPCCDRPTPTCAAAWGPYAIRHRLAGPDGKVPPLATGWF